MADALTDEERVEQILGPKVEPTGDEIAKENDKPLDQEEEPADGQESEEESLEEEKPQDEEDDKDKPADSSFTKQFPNLKGETLEEYMPELEKAYDNSFKEALRLNDVIKEKDKTIQDNAAVIEQANQIIAQAKLPADGSQSATSLPTPNPDTPSPEIEWIRNERRRVMMQAFDKFKEEYPQVLDTAEFERFRLATDGVKAALAASSGREPTDEEIFKSVAGSFGWQAAAEEDKKNAVIKENASTSRTPGSGTQSAAPSKKPKVSDAEIDVYQKMFTSKTREDAIKELSEVK